MLPEGPNLYGYVGNDPTNALDSYGLDRRIVGANGIHVYVAADDYDENGNKTGSTFCYEIDKWGAYGSGGYEKMRGQ